MDFDKRISAAGVSEEMLLFVHSRTANAAWSIQKARLAHAGQPGEPVLVDVLLDISRHAWRQYSIDAAKSRQKRINLLLSPNKSDNG